MESGEIVLNSSLTEVGSKMRATVFIFCAVCLTITTHSAVNAADVLENGAPSTIELPDGFSELYSARALADLDRYLKTQELITKTTTAIARNRVELCKSQVMIEEAVDQHKFRGNLPAKNREAFAARITECEKLG